MPYRYPRRNIDINLGVINIPASPIVGPTTSPIVGPTTAHIVGPTTAPTTAPDTSGDEALARSISRSLGGEFGTRDFRGSGSSGGGGDDWVPLRHRMRGFSPDGNIISIEPYMNSPSTLTGSPF